MAPARKEPDLSTYTGRIAARIRKLRQRSNLSVTEFAAIVSDKSGTTVSTSTAYGWENGNNTPNLKMLPAIAAALGVKKARNVLPNE
jgi:transcriptional regulator with XRE-family HTH domain